jgi:zinc-binding alcohol dehydrogenase/oxidoreductase
MQALALRGPGELEFGEVPDPEPKAGEVLVELRAAALNRRDLRVRDGATGGAGYPLVPGSDGAGIRRDTGEEVVIFPSLAWGPREEHPGPDFRILGGPDWGTHGELIAIPEENVFPKPRRFSWEQAAAFPLAGLTAYRALFSRARLHGGETVLVLGAGGGVATFAVQLAAQAGARVLVTSSSQEKIERARELGADGGVLYTEDGWPDAVRELTGGEGVDVVVDSAGATLPDSLKALRGGGRCVLFGATSGAEATLALRDYYFGQFSLLGTTMGSRDDFVSLLRMVEIETWTPVIDSVRPLAEGAAAYDRIERAEHMGKLVLDVALSST